MVNSRLHGSERETVGNDRPSLVKLLAKKLLAKKLLAKKLLAESGTHELGPRIHQAARVDSSSAWACGSTTRSSHTSRHQEKMPLGQSHLRLL